MMAPKKALPKLIVFLMFGMILAQLPRESIHSLMSNVPNHVAAGLHDNSSTRMMPLSDDDRVKLKDHHDSMEHVDRPDPATVPSVPGNLGVFPQLTPSDVAPPSPSSPFIDASMDSIGASVAFVNNTGPINLSPLFSGFNDLSLPVKLPPLPTLPPRSNGSVDMNLPFLPSLHATFSSEKASAQDAQKFNFGSTFISTVNGSVPETGGPPFLGATFFKSVSGNVNQPGLPPLKVDFSETNIVRPENVKISAGLNTALGTSPFAGSIADGKFATLANGSLDVNLPFVPSFHGDFSSKMDGTLDTAGISLSGNVKSDLINNVSAFLTPILTPQPTAGSTSTTFPTGPTLPNRSSDDRSSNAQPTRRPEDSSNQSTNMPSPSSLPPAPLFPPFLNSPAAIFGKIAIGMQAVHGSLMDMVNAPFVSPSVSATKRMDPVSVADIAIASPFIKINARYCVALIIVSSTLTLPIVKAGSFFAVPFVKSSADKSTVPLFVLSDNINSFAMQIDAPDLKASINAGQMIIVARTNATEKLLEPLLMALKNVNPNVNDQTIVLQPIMKSSILDDNVLPNELNTAVKQVRQLLNVDTISERVLNVVENIRANVGKAKDSFSSLISNATGGRRSYKAMSNIDFLEEVHYDRFGREIVSASRGKRDTTSSGPDLVEEITNTREKIEPTMPKWSEDKSKENANDMDDKTVEDLTDCGAHLLDMVTTECHRIETYELQSCSTDSPKCKLLAQADLGKLTEVCSRPKPAFMCNMSTTQKKGVVDQDGTPKAMKHTIYTFSIVRFLNLSHSCQNNLRCVVEKQFGCRS